MCCVTKLITSREVVPAKGLIPMGCGFINGRLPSLNKTSSLSMNLISEAPEDIDFVIKVMGEFQNNSRVHWLSDAEICSAARRCLLRATQTNGIFAVSIVPSKPRVEQIIWLKYVTYEKSVPVVTGKGGIDPTFMRPFRTYVPPEDSPQPNPKLDVMRAVKITKETIGQQPKHLQKLLTAFLEDGGVKRLAVTFADFSTGNLDQRVFARE